MTILPTILVFLVAILAIFWEAAGHGLRHLLGAQIDLLPPLVVYAALNTELFTTTALAVIGGLLFDSLSANPLGVTVMPLFIVGFFIHTRRGLILREERFAQFTLGLGASALVPVMTVLLLLTLGTEPLLDWGSLWQWIVMSLGGAALTPALFFIFDWLQYALGYQRVTETSFRPDREIRRRRRT